MKRLILSLLILCLCFTVAGASERLNDPSFLKLYTRINSNVDDYSGYANTGTPTALTYSTTPWNASCGDFDGATAKIALGDIYNGVKSVSFWVKPASTTEQFLELDGSTDIDVAGGTIGTTGWTAPSTYVDGASGATMVADVWQFVAVTSATAENASAVNLGVAGVNYGEIELAEVRFYSVQLTADEVKALFIKTYPEYSPPKQPIDRVPDLTE